MLRVDGCAFCSISLLSVYMCVRIPLSSRSIAGVSSSRALLGPGFPSNHLCTFLIDGCVATKQPKNGNLGDVEEKSNLIKLKVCDKDFRKQIWFPPRVLSFSWNPVRFSVAKCTPFMGHNTWPWSPSGLRCGVAVDVNKTKPKKSSPDPPSQKEQTNIWSKKSIRLKNKVQPIPLGVSFSKAPPASPCMTARRRQDKLCFFLGGLVVPI